MNINFTLFAQAMAFAIFIWFTVKFVWPPLMRAVENRQKTIADGLAAGERGRQELELASHRSADVVREAKQRAVDIIAQAEKRAAETAQAETARQVQELLERSRKSVIALKGRLDTLEGSAATLRAEAAELARANQALAARVAELEKPRGLLRRLMFWRNS